MRMRNLFVPREEVQRGAMEPVSCACVVLSPGKTVRMYAPIRKYRAESMSRSQHSQPNDAESPGIGDMYELLH